MVPVLAQRDHLGAELLQSLLERGGFFFRDRPNLGARVFQLVSLGFPQQSRKKVAHSRVLRGFVGDDDLFVPCILLGSTGSSLGQHW